MTKNEDGSSLLEIYDDIDPDNYSRTILSSNENDLIYEFLSKGKNMNIGSNENYPAGALSNFTPYDFIVDGVKCASMEGFLQSLKFKDIILQEHICSLVGRSAKKAGKDSNWKESQILYWQGEEYHRKSFKYRMLIFKAYFALSDNESFRYTLIESGHKIFTHSIGKKKECDTVITELEFCSVLEICRNTIRNQDKNEEPTK